MKVYNKERTVVLLSDGFNITNGRAIVNAMNTTSRKNALLENESRPPKGESSRTTILLAASKLATLKGLDGLSIGDLATEVGMSKSGLYAHFKSKEELEVATIEIAADIFGHEVLRPAMEAPAGCQRLRALAESFLLHLERRIFPGGCFFAAVAMELSKRPGTPRDKVVEIQQKWLSLLQQCFLDAQTNGEIDSSADIPQAVFETQAMLLSANFFFVMTGDTAPLNQAKSGVEGLLQRLSGGAESKIKRSKSGKA